MAHHVFRLGIELGFEELLFSTYIHNDASIRISEAAGFRRIECFSNLDRPTPETAAMPESLAADVSRTPGFRSFAGFMWNDWLFVPEGLARAERFFADPVVLSDGTLSMLLADNLKSPRDGLDICAIDGPAEADPRACLEQVMVEARRRGRRNLHVMLPSARPIEPFYDFGFQSFEQRLDVYLYGAQAGSLRFGPATDTMI